MKNNKFDDTYRKMRLMRNIALPIAIVGIIVGFIASGFLISRNRQNTISHVSQNAPRVTKQAKTKSAAPRTSNVAYNSNGYRYLFEGRIKPIITKNKPEFPAGQFNDLNNELVSNAFGGRFDKTISTINSLKKQYTFDNNRNLLIAGYYQDALAAAHLSKIDTNSGKGEYINENMIMPNDLAAMNQFTIYQVKEKFILDPGSLAPVDNNTYTYAGTVHYTKRDQGSKVPPLADGVNPITKIYERFGSDVSSVYQIQVNTKSFNDSAKMYSYVVEFTNGRTQLFGTYYNEGLTGSKAEEKSLSFFTNNKQLQQMYKNAQNNQKSYYENELKNDKK